MSDNNKQENKTEALNEGEKKTELSMEELEQVNGGGEIGNGRVNPDSGPGAAGTGQGYKSYTTSQY